MRLRDKQVLVVPMIADKCKTFWTTRQVVAEVAFAAVEILADQKFRSVLVTWPLDCVRKDAGFRQDPGRTCNLDRDSAF